MKASKAPVGMHTEVSILVMLGNGGTHRVAFDTPLGLLQVLHSAVRWAKEDMAKRRVKGRSHIDGVKVTVEYMPGDYDNIKRS